MYDLPLLRFFFFFNDTATTEIYTLSLHDALPICIRWISELIEIAGGRDVFAELRAEPGAQGRIVSRSEEHTSELQSRLHLVCRLLLEKKKKIKQNNRYEDAVVEAHVRPIVTDARQ